MENPYPQAPPRRARLRRAAALLGLIAGVYLLAQALVALPSVRSWTRLRAAEALRARVGEVALGEVRFDALFRVVAGPLELGGDPGHPAVSIDRLRLRVAPLALLRGRLELASVRLHGVLVDASRPAALSDLLARRSARSPASAPSPGAVHAWPRLHVRGLRVALATAGRPAGGPAGDAASNPAGGPALDTAEVGPFDLDLWPDEGGMRADLRLPEDGRIAVDLRRGEVMTLTLRAGGLRPGALGGLLSSLPVHFPAGALSLELDATAPLGLARAEARVSAAVVGLVVQGARLSPEPVGPFQLAATGRLTWERGARRLELDEGRLALGGALGATVVAALELAGGLPFSLSLRADQVPYSAFTAALPASLAPPEEAPRPPGEFDASLSVEGPLLSPGAWTLAADLDLSRMRAAARLAPPVALRAPFTYRPEGGPPFLVGPENPDFVPLEDLPEHLVRAVTTSEDAGFFAHAGFDFTELGIALAEGLEAGRVVRGGSTITQQLAKNLWLTRDKVLVRKVREALGAIALEATVPKARLLEIYLNVAEWGPGVFGIGQAARHWFGKDARQLSAREAAFLASVIPNPLRHESMRLEGALGEAWEQRVSEILLNMAGHGALTDDELLRALEEPLVFAVDPPTVTSVPAASGGG